jgi:hypothetical protein
MLHRIKEVCHFLTFHRTVTQIRSCNRAVTQIRNFLLMLYSQAHKDTPSTVLLLIPLEQMP